MKVKQSITKYVLALSVAVLAVIACIGFTACNMGVAAESIAFNETEVMLESKGTHSLTYTVQPENATVKVKVSDETIVKYEEGTLTALTAGETTVIVYSTVDDTVYSECAVTVNTPSGYSAYTNRNCKFVYPSSWIRQTTPGTEVAYFDMNTSSNVNLTSEKKNNAYFNAKASDFQNTITTTYRLMGFSVTFTDCTVSKDKYLGYNRVHVVYDYSVSGLGSIHQEQMVLNSGDKTYVLTVTDNSSGAQNRIATIFSEFVGIK